MAVPMTIHDAYALLNISEGDQLRPPLYDFYEKACDARERALAAMQNKDVRQIEEISEEMKEAYQTLSNSRPVYLSDAFKKAADLYPQKILGLVSALKNAGGSPSKSLVEQKKKELSDLCQAIRKIGGSHVASSTSSLLLQLFERMKADSIGVQSAWQTIGMLDEVSDKLAGMEAGEVLAECGYAAYRLSNYISAGRYFSRSIAKYNVARHQLAMVEWMHGRTQYELGYLELGFVTLRKSIDKFQYLAEHEVFGPEKRKWYNERYSEMEQTLELLIRKSGASPDVSPEQASAAGPEAPPVYATTTPVQDTFQSSIASTLEFEPEDLLRVYGVAAEIPAGGWGGLGFDTNSASAYLEVAHVLIDDKPHIVRSLRSNHLINLLADCQKYVIVKITGDSMNLDGIDKGDYVLLRQQDSAQDNDIVAAQIVDMVEDPETHATLKRLVRRGGKIVLKPNSSNKKYVEFVMNDFNDGTAYVRGIAYAVFKPVNSKRKSARKANKSTPSPSTSQVKDKSSGTPKSAQSRHEADTHAEDVLFKKLMDILGVTGDQEQATRLVESETERDPKISRADAIKRAIERLERDRK